MQTETEYRAVDGAHISDKDAVVIGRALEALGPTLTAADVVKAARAKRSPLHSYFTWDNDEAAEQYRLIQARYLIRSVQVVQAAPLPAVRAFCSVVSAEPPLREYVPRRLAVTTAEGVAALREEMRGHLEAVAAHYDENASVLPQCYGTAANAARRALRQDE